MTHTDGFLSSVRQIRWEASQHSQRVPARPRPEVGRLPTRQAKSSRSCPITSTRRRPSQLLRQAWSHPRALQVACHLGEVSHQRPLRYRVPTSLQAPLPKEGRQQSSTPTPGGPPSFLPLGLGAWGLVLPGNQGTAPDRSPRTAPATAGCCRGPWEGWPPGEAVVRLGLGGQGGSGVPHGPRDGSRTESWAWSQAARAWREVSTHTGDRVAAGQSHTTKINRENKEKEKKQHDSPEQGPQEFWEGPPVQVILRQEGDSHGAGTEGLRLTQQQAPCSTHSRYLHSEAPTGLGVRHRQSGTPNTRHTGARSRAAGAQPLPRLPHNQHPFPALENPYQPISCP